MSCLDQSFDLTHTFHYQYSGNAEIIVKNKQGVKQCVHNLASAIGIILTGGKVTFVSPASLTGPTFTKKIPPTTTRGYKVLEFKTIQHINGNTPFSIIGTDDIREYTLRQRRRIYEIEDYQVNLHFTGGLIVITAAGDYNYSADHPHENFSVCDIHLTRTV